MSNKYTIYFVSGDSSSTPITDSTPGYIASTSTNIPIDDSGSVTWTGLSNGKKYYWHSYLESGGGLVIL
jgi:hypothetical protein